MLAGIQTGPIITTYIVPDIVPLALGYDDTNAKGQRIQGKQRRIGRGVSGARRGKSLRFLPLVPARPGFCVARRENAGFEIRLAARRGREKYRAILFFFLVPVLRFTSRHGHRSVAVRPRDCAYVTV